jgi:hypothetical protein
MAAKAKKLYFDVTLIGTASSFVNLTQVTAGTPGDRYGCLLDTKPALLGTNQAREKQAAEITAIFVPRDGGDFAVLVDFVNQSNAAVPFQPQGTTTPDATKAGASAVFVANPKVRLESPGNSTGEGDEIPGTLYVQRQHSIEV